jgi:hypothetical protein
MNSSLELILNHGQVFDAVGVLGLGLLALAAIKLARVHRSWGGTMMALGAIALLMARVYLVVAPHVINDDVLGAIGPLGISLTIGLPPLLLTMGLAGVVWGLWGHERWLNHDGR